MDDPIIEYPEYVNVVELETAAFKCAKDADAWARSHGIVGLMSNIDTGTADKGLFLRNKQHRGSGGKLPRRNTTQHHCLDVG